MFLAAPRRRALALAAFLLFGTFAGSASVRADDLLLFGGTAVSEVPLPGGADEAEILDLSQAVVHATFLDDGTLVGIREHRVPEGVVAHSLVRIEGDGTVTDVGVLEPPEDAFLGSTPIDLATDSQGRLWALIWAHIWWNPPEADLRLTRIDPTDAEILEEITIDDQVASIVRADRGLWAIRHGELLRLDPDTGLLSPHLIDGAPIVVSGRAGDVDSTGALWLFGEGVCSPPCFYFQRVDPATGSAVSPPTSSNLNPAFLTISDLVVRRTCTPSETALCLLGGRFRAEVTWRNDEGVSGSGRPTPARSTDSGVFWFFDRSNWELMVKVLDACSLGGHYWVFVSGSTNVEYTLTVEDLQNGTSRSYENPPGQTALTVTDTTAFACG